MTGPVTPEAPRLSPFARALADRLSDLSEEHYCAGWLHDCEFVLWGMVLGGDRAWGMGEVAESDVADLRALSGAAGGWVRWENGPVFVPAAEWDALYGAWATRMRAQGYEVPVPAASRDRLPSQPARTTPNATEAVRSEAPCETVVVSCGCGAACSAMRKALRSPRPL